MSAKGEKGKKKGSKQSGGKSKEPPYPVDMSGLPCGKLLPETYSKFVVLLYFSPYLDLHCM